MAVVHTYFYLTQAFPFLFHLFKNDRNVTQNLCSEFHTKQGLEYLVCILYCGSFNFLCNMWCVCVFWKNAYLYLRC